MTVPNRPDPRDVVSTALVAHTREATEPLRAQVAAALAHNDACGVGPVSREEYLADADALINLITSAEREALRKIDALLEADMNRGAFMVRLEQIVADALGTA